MIQRPDFCASCPIGHVTEGFVPPWDVGSDELLIGEAAGTDEIAANPPRPFVGGAGTWLNSMLRHAKLNRDRFCITNVIGCHPPSNIFPGDDDWTFTDHDTAMKGIEHCIKNHSEPFVRSRNWRRVIALGNQALKSFTPRSGITVWRGSPLPFRWDITGGPRVVGTLHPAYLMRDPKLFSVCARQDMKKTLALPPENYTLYASIDDLRAFRSKRFVFDFEWDRQGNITLVGLSDRYYHALVTDASPAAMYELRRIFEEAEDLCGHNIIMADTMYFPQLGWNVTARLWDTILIQHAVQPDMPHSLAFTASVFTNKVFWKGFGKDDEDFASGDVVSKTQWKTWNTPFAIPREHGGYGGCTSDDEAFRLYNARDADGNFQCWEPLVATMRRYNMEDFYWDDAVPTAYICRDMNAAGLRIDVTKTKRIRFSLNRKIAALDAKLPDGLRSYKRPVMRNKPAPAGTFRPKTKMCKGVKTAKHGETPIVFLAPGVLPCPTCGRAIDSGKMSEAKIVKTPGTERIIPWNSADKLREFAEGTLGLAPVLHLKSKRPTADKNARKAWAKKAGDNKHVFLTVDALKKAIVERNSFAKEAFVSGLIDRVYFNLKPFGTSEMRLSCTGQRKGIDPNIQNQPKDIRKIYVPDDPSCGFLAGDVIQGENMITAWLAQDFPRLERLRTPGFDEHSYFTSLFLKLPYESCIKGGVNAHLRAIGKRVNHGRNYLLGVDTTQVYLELEGFQFSKSDIREMFEIWAAENARTAKWQQEVVGLARQQGYLTNPFGYTRWFTSSRFGPAAAAFLPASTLAAVVRRMQIALQPERFMQQIRRLGIGVFRSLPPGWSQRIQVHDEITLHGPADSWEAAADAQKSVMEQPWPQLNNFALGVELGWGGAGAPWGACKTFYRTPIAESGSNSRFLVAA